MSDFTVSKAFVLIFSSKLQSSSPKLWFMLHFSEFLVLVLFSLILFCIYCPRPHSDSSVGKEFACNSGDPGSIPGSAIHWRRDGLPTAVFLGFPCVSAGNESTCNAGDLGSIPGLGRSPGEGKGYPLQYSGLENSMDYVVHGVTKSQTRLSNVNFTSLLTKKYQHMFRLSYCFSLLSVDILSFFKKSYPPPN